MLYTAYRYINNREITGLTHQDWKLMAVACGAQYPDAYIEIRSETGFIVWRSTRSLARAHRRVKALTKLGEKLDRVRIPAIDPDLHNLDTLIATTREADLYANHGPAPRHGLRVHHSRKRLSTGDCELSTSS